LVVWLIAIAIIVIINGLIIYIFTTHGCHHVLGRARATGRRSPGGTTTGFCTSGGGRAIAPRTPCTATGRVIIPMIWCFIPIRLITSTRGSRRTTGAGHIFPIKTTTTGFTSARRLFYITTATTRSSIGATFKATTGNNFPLRLFFFIGIILIQLSPIYSAHGAIFLYIGTSALGLVIGSPPKANCLDGKKYRRTRQQ